MHRHTVRHRIEAVEQRTGRRLAAAQDRHELWLAIRARDLPDCRRTSTLRRYAWSVAVKVRPVCVPDVALESRVPARTRHYADRPARHLRVLTVTTRIGAAVSAFFGVQSIIVGQDVVWITVVNLASATIFLLIPLLYRFGVLVAPLVFFFVAFTSITVVCWHLGTGSGLPFYYLVAATLMVSDPRQRAPRPGVGAGGSRGCDGHCARVACSLQHWRATGLGIPDGVHPLGDHGLDHGRRGGVLRGCRFAGNRAQCRGRGAVFGRESKMGNPAT